ncbi:leucine-rich repeat domain-containing protein [Adlercreutzia sp. ZJ154]|uniref:leucine-rich repeat domain-containing protein n=1 Tax=Adlercreutzia sp. ZJ154 TaxID=2709790 RepID=UPI0013EA0FC6|nr:leucine-rich repeat domain-containing protein [Adlercreutzia sp. ZJ154]
MGVSLGVDLSDLDVCFGGFSPTLMGDEIQALAKAEESEERLRKRRAVLERAAAVEAARASEMREYADSQGNVWNYVVLDGTEVRLERCIKLANANLKVPAIVEEKPVAALADDVCANLANLHSVELPDSIVSIGYCAFRNCAELRCAVLPTDVTEYDSGWFRNCQRLEDLTLPGRLDRLNPNVFDNANIKRLHIGVGTREIYPGTFGKGNLSEIDIDTQNPYLETDGIAIYTKNRLGLVAVALKVQSYEVDANCVAIGRKAMNGMSELRSVHLPEGISAIGEHAFAHTQLREFVAPNALREILERAFFDCPELYEVRLNDGLQHIGEHAFTRTAIRELQLPASIDHIGHPITDGTHITYAGEHASFGIKAGAKLKIDKQGALLRECADGLHLEWLIDPDAHYLKVPEGVVCIDERALLNHKCIEEVELASSVREIGSAAFKGCAKLQRVVLHEGLQRIGSDAFLDTAIESLYIPETLESIGTMALVTQSAHSGRAATSLRKVSVSAKNPHFRIESGMLLTVLGDGKWQVVHYMDEQPNVAIPHCVVEIAPYAFSGASNLCELRMDSSLVDIGIRAFAVNCLVRLLHIDMAEALEGHSSFEIRFPDTDRGQHQQFVAFTSVGGFSIPTLLEHYDNAIANTSNFDAVQSGYGLSLYEQATRILERLRDPVFLTDVNRQMLERILRQHLFDICIAVAKHDDRAAIDALVDLGYLNASNISAAIDKVGAVQDAAMTGYMLEVRRCRFGRAELDFDL